MNVCVGGCRTGARPQDRGWAAERQMLKRPVFTTYFGDISVVSDAYV